MKKVWQNFWAWYNKNYLFNLSFATFLFALQLVHLFWLSTDVVLNKITGEMYFPVNNFWQSVIILVDYTEIPALITTSLVYINENRQKRSLKNILYLIFLNIQFIHIFWITDEFVVEQFSGEIKETILPTWLAWVAIAIDYLELPVIFETIKKLIDAISKKRLDLVKEAFDEE